MAITAISHSRRASSTSVFTDTSLLLRYCSTQRTKLHSEKHEAVVDGLELRSQITEAQTMSRLINSEPWKDVLERSLAEQTLTLSITNVLHTLKLIKDPSVAFQFFTWAHQMGFAHTEHSFFAMLEILGRSRNLNAARDLLFSIERKSGGAVKLEDKFFNSLIRNYGRAGYFQESVKLFKDMKSRGVSPSAISFNSLFSILLKRGRTNMVKKLYDEMLGTYGVTPDTFTFNILITGFCKNSMVDEGFHFFKEMERVQCKPDVITYNTLVDGLCQEGKVDIARNVVNGMSKKSPDLNPNVVTYTTLIRGYCSKQEVDEALLVFNEMARRGVKPNKITYNTLLKGLCEAHRLDSAREILEGATIIGEFIPDTCTFNTLIYSHCQAGKLDEALKVFTKMPELKVRRDSATYSVLIRSLCQQGNHDRAEELFDELSESDILSGDLGCKPLVASYNPMFEHLCRNGKTNKAEVVFRQLMRRGTQDPPSYKTLITGHCREGMFESANELLVLMLRQDFVPDVEIYKSLISGFLMKGKPLLAKSTLEKMLKSSHLPSASTFHSILAKLLEHGCARQSEDVVKLMLEKKIRQSITISTKLLMLLFSSELGDNAFELIGLLYKNGYSVNIGELVGSLCKDSKLVEACKALQFVVQKNQAVEIELLNFVISGLCKTGKASEAFGLYNELVEKGVQEQLMCAGDLKAALEVAGKSAEAEFVSKRIPIEQHNHKPLKGLKVGGFINHETENRKLTKTVRVL